VRRPSALPAAFLSHLLRFAVFLSLLAGGTLAAPAVAAAKPVKKSKQTKSAKRAKPCRGKACKTAPAKDKAAELVPAMALHDPTGQALRHWLDATEQARRGKGVARAMFWGASHTAADFWTGHLRRLWHERWGDAGHGFAQPVRFHPGYRHTDLNITASVGWQVLRWQADAQPPQTEPLDAGLQGALVTSGDPADFAELRTTTDNPGGRTWKEVEVWAKGRPDGGTLRIEHEGPDGTEVVLLTTRGTGLHVATLRDKDAPHRLRLSPVGDGPVSLYGTVTERGRSGVVLDQMGIPGMRASVWLHWQEAAWAEQVQRRQPDLIVLAYGTNDVGDADEPLTKYAATWRQVLQRLRRVAPKTSCILVGPTDRLEADGAGGKRTMPRTPGVIAVQRQVANEFGCAHFDAAAAMGGGMPAWQKAKLAQGDDVHLTKLGYEAMAVQLDEAMTRHGQEMRARDLAAKKAAEAAARKAARNQAKPKGKTKPKAKTKAKRKE
jgi:lysophospholipase L1-like esterase